jgi:hypothetical protein
MGAFRVVQGLFPKFNGTLRPPVKVVNLWRNTLILSILLRLLTNALMKMEIPIL